MSQRTEVTFFPSIRRGYRPDEPFSAAETTVPSAGTTAVTLDVTGTGEAGTDVRTATVPLRVYGPGDVTGVDHRQVIRTEPEPDTTEFPPNYFPLVEFDRPDLPWLFSPTTADDAGRNRPWLCLVCVPVESADVVYTPAGTSPCPVLEAPARTLPDPAQSWAWAHAQLLGAAADEVAELDRRSTKTLSRLVCPVNLAPNRRYRACVVPTYESGRRAGLGLTPERGTTSLAWGREGVVRLPVYFSWQFTTSAAGDFESLARELEPRELGPGIGTRTVDVSNPGPEELKLAFDEATDTGTVAVGGALRSVGAEPDPYDESMRDELRDLLNRPGEIAAATDFGTVGPPLYGRWHAGVPELEAAPPIDDPDRYYYPTWFDELNVDPRRRLAAGFGTQVVRENQDALMTSAWEQFGEIREANRALRRAKLASAVLDPIHERLASYSTTRLLGVAAPVRATLFDEAAERTVLATLAESEVSEAVSSTAFNRALRPTGPLARRTAVSIDRGALAARVEANALPRLGNGLASGAADATEAAGTLDSGAAVVDEGTPTLDPDVLAGGGQLRPLDADVPAEGGPTVVPAVDSGPGTGNGPESEADLGPGVERVRTALDGLESHCLAAEASVTTFATAIAGDDAEAVARSVSRSPTVDERAAAVGANTFGQLSRSLAKVVAAGERGDAVPIDDAYGRRAMRDLHRENRRLVRLVGDATADVRSGEYDPTAVERRLDRALAALDAMLGTASRLRSALAPAPELRSIRAMSASVDASDPGLDFDLEAANAALAAPPTALETVGADETVDFASLRGTVLDGLEPVSAIAAHLGARLHLPLSTREDPVEEVLAAPLFDRPLAERLAALNQEYFLPGAGEIPKNTVGVLETNPEFVEAFVVGANHEMSRELRWRKFPTDRRGTYFRRFWDRRSDPAARAAFEAGETDAYDDVTPVHTWDENGLGENDPRGDGATVVLLVKGELLRRYPNTDVFAAKAVADDPDDGSAADRVPALPNTHVSREDEGEDVKFPVFRGRLEPDVTFFGFDLSTDEALYEPYHDDGAKAGEGPADHPDEGWFFCLQEPPAETRFGLDVGTEADRAVPVGITHATTSDGRSAKRRAGRSARRGKREAESDRGVPPGIASAAAGRARTTEQVARLTAENDDDFEHGWDALSWWHLVSGGETPDAVDHVDVEDSPPGRGDWAVEAATTWVDGLDAANPGPHDEDVYGSSDAARWGRNAAHMARITRQRPVRVSIHADDMLPEGSRAGGSIVVDRLRAEPDARVATAPSTDRDGTDDAEVNR